MVLLRLDISNLGAVGQVILVVIEAGDPGLVAELGLVQQLLSHGLREQIIVQIDLPLGTDHMDEVTQMTRAAS